MISTQNTDEEGTRRNLTIMRVHMRHLTFFGLFIAVLALTADPAAAVDDPFRFEGNGWGHGVGLSQYGSQSRALDGQTAEEIVTTYYKGSSVTATPDLPTWFTDDPEPLWVGLLEDRTRFDFTADAGTLGLCQGAGPCPDSAIGSPQPGEQWSFRVTGTNRCQFYKGSTAMGPEDNCYARITLGDDTNTRVTLLDEARTYARGQIVIRPVVPNGSTTVHVVAELSMEDYVLGIGESILKWEPAALQAQAIASRTYAGYWAVNFGPASGFSDSASIMTDCWCHVEDGSGDQVYKGWEIEDTQTYGVNWVDAVNATAGKYITHPNETFTRSGLILALFSSSNGGASETNTAAFGSATLYPYLDTVPDSYSLIGNKWAPWPGGISVDASTILSKLGELTRLDRVRVFKRNPSGSAMTVLFEGKNGDSNTSTTRTGTWSRWNLGLRSTFIDRVCRERGPYDDDGCSFFEHNIVNIYSAGFVGTMPGNDYQPDSRMTRSTMAAFLVDGLNLPASSTNHFTDDDSDPNHSAINALADAGITIGYGDGTYRPQNSVTRAEMAVYLARALGVSLPTTVPDPFPDVPGDSWFGPAVAEVLDRGITVGHSDGGYKPHTATTRGQMAAFIDRGFLGGF